MRLHGDGLAFEILLTRVMDSDARTIEGLKRRDPGAMADLYDRYGRFVYSVVYRIVGNGGVAEDVVQEVFIRVWTRAYLLDDSSETIAAWLLTIARNLAIDTLRAGCRRDRCVESIPCEFIPGSIFKPSDYTDELQRAFQKLTPNQRSVIEFAYFEGLTQTEIAEKLDKPLGTVKTWLRTALCTLRQNFEEHGGELKVEPREVRK